MDASRFDALTRRLVTPQSRRGLLGAAAALLGVGHAPRVAASHLGPGDSCRATEDCSQDGGTAICASNGIASDGELNCCRETGGICTSSAGCCNDLVCADNGIASDGPYNCCRNEGGTCGSGEGCCGALRCLNGVCQSGSGGNLAPGAPCTSISQCSQHGGTTVCANNGIRDDGTRNCCRHAGAACATKAGCCGGLLCVDGVCQGGSGG